MHHGQDNHLEELRECERCKTPMVKGHGMVCALHAIAEASFYVGILLLVIFWILLVKQFVSSFVILNNGEDTILLAILAAVNSGLFMLLSILCGMRAKWLRHQIVSSDENYLDAEGSCCGGACAGSCGEGGCDDGDCGEEGCSPEGCDDADCCKKEAVVMEEEEQGCCGGGCCK